MRVLHVIDGLQLGGAEALLYRLVQRPSAVEHEVACLGGRDWYSPRLEQAGVTVHHLGKDSFAAAPLAIGQLRGLIRRRKIDVVQTWLYRSNMLGGIAARSSGIPVAWSIHCSSLEPLSRASRELVRLSGIAARWVPDFIINCSSCSAELHDRFGFGAAPGTVIPNGYDTAVFSPDEARRADCRAALGLSGETFVIGSITRWIDYKDVPSLLGALDIARQRGVDATCLLIGKDLSIDNAELAASIASFGPGDRIVPLGKREDIADLARAMDLHMNIYLNGTWIG